jgi:hypothetical protein
LNTIAFAFWFYTDVKIPSFTVYSRTNGVNNKFSVAFEWSVTSYVIVICIDNAPANCQTFDTSLID